MIMMFTRKGGGERGEERKRVRERNLLLGGVLERSEERFSVEVV